MLDVEMLKAMPPGCVFATGVVPNSPEGVYMTDNKVGENLRWYAKRGSGAHHDWTIYIGWAVNSLERLIAAAVSDKVTNENNIKKLVPCTDEAFELYRR